MENSVVTKTTRPTTGLGNLSWIWQAVTGVGLVVLAGLHMFANHFVVEGGLRNFHDAQVYLQNPIFLPIEGLFLAVVTTHALLGVRAILFDLGFTESTERRITISLAVVGVLTVAYGLWLTWAVITYR
jgi:succinate dehydrogenase hydrophobic anchor subunit